jgi:hypothetical protein
LRRLSVITGLACVLITSLAILSGAAGQQNTGPQPGNASEDAALPDGIRGPFVSRPEVTERLDCPTDACDGPLNFAKLIQARLPKPERTGAVNPFNLGVTHVVRDTVEQDLNEIRNDVGADDDKQLSPRFLTDEGSRVELVGVIDRMDRQFIKDPTLKLTREQLDCGEISLIYRFSYSIRRDTQKSRLPVTMNIVLPAVPYDTRGGKITCQNIARRWLKEIRKPPGRTPEQTVADLLNPDSGPLAFITGKDILRLELNMQAYRLAASTDDMPGGSHMGTKAAYIIRVFKWDFKNRQFVIHFLRNQIDRSQVVCGPETKDCARVQRQRAALVAFLQTSNTIEEIDKGTFEIPYGMNVLAERGISISPGGMHRSGNQAYWNARDADKDVISDAEIEQALKVARAKKLSLSFIKNKEDFRTRLNESTCTGCHQTRAIAGFHFPGADRDGTAPVNSVFVPGSPHFYGDQPRRIEILNKIAARTNPRLIRADLAASYAARPMNSFKNALTETKLLGGWGATCLTDAAITGSQRQWRCAEPLVCRQLFKSDNDPGIGTCTPEPGDDHSNLKIGDALQVGTITTTAFGKDNYKRTDPPSPDHLIPKTSLPPNPPPGNSYYGAHQEYYDGDPCSERREARRNGATGGFPAGMLRLSECVGLPAEASCGLIASSGFTDCIKKLGSGDPAYNIDVCFTNFTSYAGLRACDAASPCRDDYICVKPMKYEPGTTRRLYEDRKSLLSGSSVFRAINRRPYDPDDYGQQFPILNSNYKKGLCIPPYFVLQFRSDGHPAPPIPGQVPPPVQLLCGG